VALGQRFVGGVQGFNARMMWRWRGSARSGGGSRALAALLMIVCLGVSVGGCGSIFNKEEDYVPEDPADKLYNEGLFLLNNKQDYEGAAKKFDEVDRQNPYSDWARKALLMSAFSYYQAQKYEDCINAAKRYVTLHPGSQDTAYAQYLIGASYYDQILDVNHDQARADRAVSALEEVVRKYPDTEYALSAKKKIDMARDQLAGKEMEVGRFYMKKRDFTGAINRFKVVVTHFQTTREVEEALERLTEAYIALGILDEAQTAAALLGHNFPDSPWYKDAFRLVTSAGGQPTENKDSWMSRAFKPRADADVPRKPG
jgi:outer membrane protein assembly factor BamD